MGSPLTELAVILATYNEAENLTQLVEALEDLGEDLQLVVVDDDSPDRTGLIAQQLSSSFGNITIINRSSKQGLGSALQTGLAVSLDAGAQYVMTMDADLSHDPADVLRLLSTIKTGLEQKTPAAEPGSQLGVPLGGRNAPGMHHQLPGFFPPGCIGSLVPG